MTDDDDDIPILTDAFERTPPKARSLAPDALAELEAALCSVSLRRAEEIVREACREAEHVLLERVMHDLRNELPVIVKRALRDHFES